MQSTVEREISLDEETNLSSLLGDGFPENLHCLYDSNTDKYAFVDYTTRRGIVSCLAVFRTESKAEDFKSRVVVRPGVVLLTLNITFDEARDIAKQKGATGLALIKNNSGEADIHWLQ